MLGPSNHAYIFRHHFAQSILVASTECPTMPSSTPLLDTLKTEKSAHKEGSKGIILTARTAPPPVSEAKQGGDSTPPLGKLL